ncbi:MAG: ribonuclease P protein component [Prolixibacteraceae bacterium]|nr:ribonuclease P protein component [Prolixibacteraceae bacterium]
MAQRYTLKKQERLSSKILLDKLFKQGKTIFAFPFKFVFIETDDSSQYPAQVAFSVPKKRFKKAVERNLIRRRMKEAYRLNKHIFYNKAGVNERMVVFLIIYIDKEICNYTKIEKGLVKGLKMLAAQFGTSNE